VARDGAATVATPKRRHSRHGYHALRAKVKARGLAVLDARAAGARALLTWRQDLYAALGGEAEVTPQRRTDRDRGVQPLGVPCHRDLTKTKLPEVAFTDLWAAIELAQEMLGKYFTAYEDAAHVFEVANVENEPGQFLEWCRLDDYAAHFAAHLEARRL
jgi:hypothetical protein